MEKKSPSKASDRSVVSGEGMLATPDDMTQKSFKTACGGLQVNRRIVNNNNEAEPGAASGLPSKEGNSGGGNE